MKIHYDKTMQMKATNFQQNMSASSNVPEIWRRVVCYCYNFLMLKIKCEQGLEMSQTVQATCRKNSAYNNPYFLNMEGMCFTA